MAFQPRKFCIKTIKSNHFLYSWRYLNKKERLSLGRKQRYKWTYHGKYGSNKAKEILQKLPYPERKMIEEEYEEKVRHKAKVQAIVNNLIRKGSHNLTVVIEQMKQLSILIEGEIQLM